MMFFDSLSKKSAPDRKILCGTTKQTANVSKSQKRYPVYGPSAAVSDALGEPMTSGTFTLPAMGSGRITKNMRYKMH